MLLVCHVQVRIEIPFAFRAIPAQAIESTGSQVLEQILKAMLPRFMSQVCEDNDCYYNSYFPALTLLINLSFSCVVITRHVSGFSFGILLANLPAG